MGRRKKKEKRLIVPDPKYNSTSVTKFVNQIMKGGKKSVARKIVHRAFEIIKEKVKKDPLEIFDQAIDNVAPLLEVKSRRIGGATYQIPVEVRGDRRITLSMRWIVTAARGKKGRPMAEKLAAELIDAANETGVAVKKKQDIHRMAEANKAFAHFAW